MSDDVFTTSSSTSWFGRIGGAILGVPIGLLLFAGAFVVLWMNEGRAIHRQKTLETGAKMVISASADGPSDANEGKLVHVTGKAEATGLVADTDFGITSHSLKLRRNVEMYQWKETKKSEKRKKLGGSEETVTTYTYAKDWSSSLNESSKFEHREGHVNPSRMPVDSRSFAAPGIHVGKFELTTHQADRIDNFAPRSVTAEEAKLAAEKQSKAIRPGDSGGLMICKDPQNPEVGDVKITFEEAPAGSVSIVAKQIHNTFEPFAVGSMGTIDLFQTGTFSAELMFKKEQQGNTIMTWVLRLVGLLMMLIGISMVTRIFSVAASVIPFLGDVVGMGTGFIGLIIALPLSLLTISLAWFAYRPLIGIPLLILAVGCIVYGIRAIKRSKQVA